MKRILLFPFFLLFIFSGCGIRERELALEKKATELNQKEQELLLKEKTLQLKEEELISRQQQLDSTRQYDSSLIYNPTLIGTWAVRMVCTEATCPGSAVGDTKTEHWQILYEGNNIIAKAMVGEKLVRVYTGTYNGTTLELNNEQNETGQQQATRMVVRIRLTNDQTMEGQREIIREGNCKIVYSLQLNKQPS